MKYNSKITTKLTNMIKQKYTSKSPGISIMAIKRGNIVYDEQFGLANLEYDIPVTSSTVFNLASITKQFTAMAMVVLVEHGVLGFDDKITNFLPELLNYNGVTVRHLLNNCSGIENYYRIVDRLNMSAINITNKEVYNLLIDEQKLLFEPGTRFDYSNSNWVLLAMIIERLTGLSYGKYMEVNIFKKLGMINTRVFDEKQPIVKNRAYGYRRGDNKFYCEYLEALTIGDGGVFSTIGDLYKWDQALYTGKLVSKENIELSFSNGIEDGEEQYGFGWSLGEDEVGNKKIWSTGLDAGFRSVITRYLDSEFTVVILSNSSECTWEERKEITTKLYKIYHE